MVKKDFPVDVDLDVLKWTISTSGMTEVDIAKKTKVPTKDLQSWIKGETKPTLRDLELLAKVVKRPLAVFFLSEPPAEKPPPKDYRMLPGRQGKFERKTILAIRRARHLQSITKELMENLGQNPKSKISVIKRRDDPIKVANMYRSEFEFTLEKQRDSNSPYDIFNFLRERIEDKNINVFQMSMSIEDARGFTLVDQYPAVIVVNTKDIITARIFSLMHEFGHVLLEESGVSLPENSMYSSKRTGVERWCNDFASSFLFPPDLARMEFSKNKSSLTQTRALTKMSRRYKVSKAMLLYRMFKLRYITRSQYDVVLKRYYPKIISPKVKKKKRSKGGLPADRKCLSERGQRFTYLVVENIDRGHITHSDAMGYLSIKAKNLEKVMSQVKK